jgi:hypothetical protein
MKNNNNSETVSEKIILEDNFDYKKVIVLKESETIGLTKSENLKGHHSIAKVKQRSYIAK